MKIILSGGGTLGPVTPLLALREIYLNVHPETQFIWVGTKFGPERVLIEKSGCQFFTITSGKYRRYFSLWNFFDIFKIIVAFFQSLFLILNEKPDLLISAGGFVSVPLHWAGWMLGVPEMIHQQDRVPGFANKLMAAGADKITVTLKDSLQFFSKRKSELLGNPARNLGGIDKIAGRLFFKFNPTDQVIFVLGGGTGSLKLNQMLIEALPHWPKNWQVIHLVGKERPKELAERAVSVFPNYHVFEFFTEEMKYAYAAADVVVARAGFGTLTELAALKKAAILLPKSGHQEENAKFFERAGGAVVLNEEADSGLKLAKVVADLVNDPPICARIGDILHSTLLIADPKRVVEIIDELIVKK